MIANKYLFELKSINELTRLPEYVPIAYKLWSVQKASTLKRNIIFELQRGIKSQHKGVVS